MTPSAQGVRNAVPQLVDPAATERLVADRVNGARENTERGWCPCGDERDGDCECFGTYRLSAVQGLVPIRHRALADAFDQERES